MLVKSNYTGSDHQTIERKLLWLHLKEKVDENPLLSKFEHNANLKSDVLSDYNVWTKLALIVYLAKYNCTTIWIMNSTMFEFIIIVAFLQVLSIPLNIENKLRVK